MKTLIEKNNHEVYHPSHSGMRLPSCPAPPQPEVEKKSGGEQGICRKIKVGDVCLQTMSTVGHFSGLKKQNKNQRLNRNPPSGFLTFTICHPLAGLA